MTQKSPLHIPHRADEDDEVDYSAETGDDHESLARDRVPIRSMEAADLAALIAIDRRHTGLNREAYFKDKLAEALEESGVRISLVAEQENRPVGFIMARVDFGGFGQTVPEAVIDVIGIDPGYRHQGVATALMSQLLANMRALNAETVRTEVNWNDYEMLAFLEQCGFSPAQRLAFRRRPK